MSLSAGRIACTRNGSSDNGVVMREKVEIMALSCSAMYGKIPTRAIIAARAASG